MVGEDGSRSLLENLEHNHVEDMVSELIYSRTCRPHPVCHTERVNARQYSGVNDRINFIVFSLTRIKFLYFVSTIVSFSGCFRQW